MFTFGYTPLQGVYPVENLENTARAKGMALSGVIVSIVGFINTYAGPIALSVSVVDTKKPSYTSH